ncbi:MAG: hypothetical protein HPY64_13635 [Anaerolineae bacterium]|nr:hypothetical protein [Anaerolineae bacterium]
MAEVNDLIREGVAALKAGRRAEARELLTRATELDQMNEQAWLFLSGVVDSEEDQEICLENVLVINPNNARAQEGLRILHSRRKEKAVPPAAPLPTADDPFVVPDADLAPGVATESGINQPVDLPSAGSYGPALDETAALEPDMATEVDLIEEPFGTWDDGETETGPRPPQIDPYAIPQSNVFDLDDGVTDETLEEEPVGDYEAYAEFPLYEEDAAQYGAALAADAASLRANNRLLGHLEFLPPEIKPSHLPGKGPLYPPVLLAGLALTGVGIVAALVVMIILLIG